MGKRCEEIELGDVAKDDVTGFQGAVMAITRWLHGCDRIVIQPQDLDKDGKVKETQVFDRLQMTLVKKNVVVVTTRAILKPVAVGDSTPGGPQNDRAALRR